MSDNILRFSDAVVDFWLDLCLRPERGVLVSQKFIINDLERETLGKFFQKYSLNKNYDNFKTLRAKIYNEGEIGGYTILDDKDGHDRLSFFSVSYLYSIFWLLEDSPCRIDESSGDTSNFLSEIELMSKGLLENNTQVVFQGVLNLFKIADELQSRKKAIFKADKAKFNFRENGKFHDKDSEFRNLLLNCWNKNYQQCDVYNLFDPEICKDVQYIDLIVNNIYKYIYDNDCNYIVGIERGGIPLASLVAYKFNIPCHLFRTVPQLKVLPRLPSGERIVILDDVAITGTTIKQARKHIEETYTPKGLITISLIQEKRGIELNKGFIFIPEPKNHKPDKVSFQDLKNINVDTSRFDNNVDLIDLLKKRCISESKEYWCSEFTYTKDVFYRVCDWFIEKINEEFNEEFAIIATSIYGLPFASVTSYQLRKPLFLYSRRSNFKHDFRPISLERLTSKIDNGLKSIALIDDIYKTGTTNKLIIEKLNNLGIDGNKIKSFVVANLSDKNVGMPISCLNRKMIYS